MNANVNDIYAVVEEIKENITDCQYKIVMDNLMILNKREEQKRNKCMIGLILDQIKFFYQYIPKINDVTIRNQFSSRLDLLKKIVNDINM